MRHFIGLAASVSFALLLTSISTTAQSGKVGGAGMEGRYRAGDSLSLVFTPYANAACPVRLRAQHGSGGAMRKVDENRPEGIAQKLHLTLASKDSRQVTGARLRVRGVSGTGRLNRADGAQNGMDATRNVTVKLRPSAEGEATGDVWVPRLSAVLQVDLSSVTFSDGEVQQFSAIDGCRFTPDNLMLIANGGN